MDRHTMKVWLIALACFAMTSATAAAQEDASSQADDATPEGFVDPELGDDTAGPYGMADPEAGLDGDLAYEAEFSTQGFEDPTGPTELGSLILALEVGGFIPFHALGPHLAAGLELGYVLPFLERRIDVFFGMAYAAPSRAFTTEEEYDARVTQQTLFLSLGPRARLFELGRTFNASLAAGPRLHLQRSTSNGSRDGEPFAEYRAQSTRFGFFVAAGGELILGPGALLLDVDFGWARLPHEITGDVSAAALTLTLGYRLFVL